MFTTIVVTLTGQEPKNAYIHTISRSFAFGYGNEYVADRDAGLVYRQRHGVTGEVCGKWKTMPRTFTTTTDAPDTRDLSDDRSYGCPACDVCHVDVDYPATRCEECSAAVTTTEGR